MRGGAGGDVQDGGKVRRFEIFFFVAPSCKQLMHTLEEI